MDNGKIFVPVSILLAGLIIGGAIFITRGGGKNITASVIHSNPTSGGEELAISPINSSDHIKGSREAKIFIVEYSDFECPFCSKFHDTMNKIIAEYGGDGRVAWIYRRSPLEQIHLNARRAALASECVADIAGNDAFWQFSDIVFADQENTLTSEDGLKIAAINAGADENKFNDCMLNANLNDEINDDLADIQLIVKSLPDQRGFGTPYNIVISKNNIQTQFVGAISYDSVKKTIDTILGQ